MNSYFKTAMSDLFLDHTNKYYLRSRGLDYGKIIAFGAFGETGENYYVFIYRNVFEKATKYGAVVFLYSPLDLEKPVQVACTDTGIDWEQRNIYITAAVYFLKNRCRNTMALSGTVKFLYEDIKKFIDRHAREQDQKKGKFENFNFDIRDQEIRARLMKLKPPNEHYISFNIRSRLEELKKKEGDKIKSKNKKQSKGRLGLSLELPGDYNPAQFKPVIIPVKKNGSYGAVREAVPSRTLKYDFEDAPELLKEFMTGLHDLGHSRRQNYTGTETINRVYFERLAGLFLNMPDELTFFQFEPDDRDFHHIQKITFKKIEVKFAPQRDRECLGFWLVLTSDDGRVLEAGTDYRAIVMGKNRVYLFFITSGQQGEHAYFALPEDPGKYNRFFHFLAEVEKFYIHDFAAIRDTLKEIESASLVIHPEPLPFYKLKFHPTPVLKILEGDLYENKPERIEVEFDYQPGVDRFLRENPHIRLVDYEIDNNFETMCLRLLGADPLLNMQKGYDFWGQRTRDYYFSFTDGSEITWLIERGTTYLDKSSFKILEGMLRLRQICLFPQLVDEKYETVPSVKFDHFTEMLEDILSEGHKVLVFSQFVKVLSIIKRHFDREKISYSYIDGSVDAVKRGKVIKAFQEDDTIGVFLLSLKAGGVAINLTAADYVIIFDPWWNPAVEAQAIDRSHRIGQTKRVIVYRMVVKNTIEEKMLELQEQKKELVEKLITSETKAFKNLTKDDIIKLFQYS